MPVSYTHLITNIASKAGKILAGAFAIKKITEFTSACLDLGSDLAEVQNVVDVTFSKMNEQVNNFAQNAVFQFGLSETMAKQYTGTFGAMAKAFGFVESEAYAMSTTLTGLAGDVASFYNITQGEAYTKLKSVFTGEKMCIRDRVYIFKKRKKKNITLNAKFFRINDRKLNALIKATKKDFKNAQLAMLRMANDCLLYTAVDMLL